MKPEAQRIAIAEACGWHAPTDDSPFIIPDEPESGLNLAFYWTDPTGSMASRPDYINDLNAMHEAEKTLNEQQQMSFCDALYDIAHGFTPTQDGYAPGYWEVSMGSVFPHVHATADQRAEAFLRTIGKWEA